MNTPDNFKIKTALISVSDKTGIVDFARRLSELGIEIYSTGGTAKKLINEGIDVKYVSDVTGFPEIMDGRVKTLHPKIHAGLLADMSKKEHEGQLKEHGINSIDLLVVNLYPFEEAMAGKNLSDKELVEYIDIGGPAMLRAAAKNYRWTAPVVHPEKYDLIIDLLKQNENTIPEDFRKQLAANVFEHTAHYDSVISNYFTNSKNIAFPENLTIPLKKEQALRYGENPHQDAALYGSFTRFFRQLHGKELSYNNIVDMDAAAKLILEFGESAFAIIKHTNPCGVGLDNDLSKAYDKAFATDNVSPFGGIFIVNRPLDVETADKIHGIFSEVIIAPEFEDGALEILKKKKNRRLITVDFKVLKNSIKYDIRSVSGGFLMQDSDNKLTDSANMKVVTKRQPTDDEMEAMMFGWKVAKHVKSNSIVYTAKDRTLGIGAGQMSRVDSSRIAVEKSKLMGLGLKGSAVASDAFFPFADGLLEAVEAGATCVIQPGGSVRDEEVIKAADENDVAMVFTGTRHFRH